MEVTECPLCCSNTYHTYLKAPSVDWTEEFTICQCDKCGLCFVNPRPSIVEIGQYYSSSYHSVPSREKAKSKRFKLWLQYAVLQTHYGWPPKMLPALARILAASIESRFGRAFPFHAGKRLLDIGSGNGEFLLWVRDLCSDWQLTGVELSNAACEIAHQFGLKVHNGTLEAQTFPDASFDVVTMWNVLEHLHDPMGTLREVHRVLVPGGNLALVVPNIASPQYKRFGADWWVLQLPQHLTFFNQLTLQDALSQAGFTVLRLQPRQVTYSALSLTRQKQKPRAKESPKHWRIMFERAFDLVRRGDVIKAIAAKAEE